MKCTETVWSQKKKTEAGVSDFFTVPLEKNK
jgi:hypothetical protein